jgi:hypothetical protein
VPRHDFSDENNPSSILAAVFATDIEAQVYFIEIGMKRNRKTPKQPGAAKPKTHEANICFSLI